MHKSVLCCALLAGALAALAPQGGAAAPVARVYIDDAMVAEIRAGLSNEVVTMLVKAQNARHAEIGQAEIEALDKTWRAEREQDDKPLIAATLTNPLSIYLLRMQAQGLGLYSEIFVTDDKGLNVGQSAITSDYWQGDEAKFQKTFPVGAQAVFIDDAEWHEDSATWRAQVNLTIADPADGAAIGAATVEINLTELARRRGLAIAAAPAQ